MLYFKIIIKCFYLRFQYCWLRVWTLSKFVRKFIHVTVFYTRCLKGKIPSVFNTNETVSHLVKLNFCRSAHGAVYVQISASFKRLCFLHSVISQTEFRDVRRRYLQHIVICSTLLYAAHCYTQHIVIRSTLLFAAYCYTQHIVICSTLLYAAHCYMQHIVFPKRFSDSLWKNQQMHLRITYVVYCPHLHFSVVFCGHPQGI
jgi:hypothetical protein